MKKHVNNLLGMELCTGCTACESSCPKKCIKMKMDDEGFKVPMVEESSCINCGICSSVCPVLNLPDPCDREEAYAMISKDQISRERSSSGGVMSLLAELVLEKQGTVYGAAYDPEFRVVHKRIDRMEHLDQIRRAKYAQSDLSDIFGQVEQDLQSGPVLFVGTPCQCAGLRSFINRKSSLHRLSKPKENSRSSETESEADSDHKTIPEDKIFSKNSLILADFVCHSIPSPKVWNNYINWRSGGELPSDINQRRKVPGWSRYDYSSEFSYSDGNRDLVRNAQDIYMKLFIGDFITRLSCSDCHFKGSRRSSDLTLGDFWGIWDLDPEMDDNKGTSLVIVHTEKGNEILREIQSKTDSRKVELSEALKQNPAYFRISEWPIQRKRIMHQALNSEFESLKNEMIPTPRRVSKLRKLASLVVHGIIRR